MLLKILNRFAIDEIRYLNKKWFSSKSFCPQELNGKLTIVGVPFGKGQKKTGNSEKGLEMAPDTLRQLGFIEILKEMGLDIEDSGNVSFRPEEGLQFSNMINLDHFAPCAKEVSIRVSNVLKKSRACLVLGGDHSLATGSIYGHLCTAGPDNVAVIYVDAHGDINTSLTSETGNLHGMPLAMLAAELRGDWPDAKVPGLQWLQPCLPLKNVGFIGLRSVDSPEANFLRDHNVVAYSMEEVDKYGIQKVVCEVLSKLDQNGVKSIHLSFDIDSLDSLEAPCTTAPVRGGLTLREGQQICETLHRTGRLSVVDFVEVNPAIGTEVERRTTLDAAKHILLSMFGYVRGGNCR